MAQVCQFFALFLLGWVGLGSWGVGRFLDSMFIDFPTQDNMVCRKTPYIGFGVGVGHGLRVGFDVA